ncbi:MAG: hypothetical protein JSS72_04775 [Armatimonadetes bacterium]|nr:hypothetical protein [Armatimonadota bacterium]
MTRARGTITIDGAHGEGSGALFRTAVTMSVLTQQAVHIENIRGASSFPGLDAEDIQFLRALQASSKADVERDEVGSSKLTFAPTRKACKLEMELPDIEGSRRNPNALVVQGSLIPVLARAGAYSVLESRGETYGFNSLTYDYFVGVSSYALGAMGINAMPELIKAGYGRDSFGELKMEIEPSAVQGIEWTDRGKRLSCNAIITTSNLPQSIAHRGTAHLAKLAAHAGIEVTPMIREVPAERPGVFVTMYATYQRGVGGATAMGARSVRMEHLVQTAFQQTMQWMSGPETTDPFVADQLLIPAMLAEGPTTFTTSCLTLRFLTTVWVMKQFVPIRVTISGQQDGPGAVNIRMS